MIRPAYGICSPCTYLESRDGDSHVVKLPIFETPVALRLIDCWCMESDDKRPPVRQAGLRAKALAEDVLNNTDPDQIGVFVPAWVFAKGLIKSLTFDRVKSHLFIGDQKTLNEMIVLSGHGYRTKKEQLAAEKKLVEAA